MPDETTEPTSAYDSYSQHTVAVGHLQQFFEPPARWKQPLAQRKANMELCRGPKACWRFMPGDPGPLRMS